MKSDKETDVYKSRQPDSQTDNQTNRQTKRQKDCYFCLYLISFNIQSTSSKPGAAATAATAAPVNEINT